MSQTDSHLLIYIVPVLIGHSTDHMVHMVVGPSFHDDDDKHKGWSTTIVVDEF